MFTELAPYIVSAGGAVSYLLAWREKKAAASAREGDALQIMQMAYAQFAKDAMFEIGQLKEEVRMLTEVVRAYKQTCDSCPHKQNKL